MGQFSAVINSPSQTCPPDPVNVTMPVRGFVELLDQGLKGNETASLGWFGVTPRAGWATVGTLVPTLPWAAALQRGRPFVSSESCKICALD